MFGRGVTWRITGGVSAFGVLEEANGLVRGYRWVREHDEGRQAGSRVGVGDWEQNSQESRARADRRLWAKASRGIRQWREGGSWTSLMRVSARSTPTGRHSGGLAAAAGRWWRSGIQVFNHTGFPRRLFGSAPGPVWRSTRAGGGQQGRGGGGEVLGRGL